MSRTTKIAIAIAIAIPFAAGYAWNVWRNVDSLARTEHACTRLRAARGTAWATLEESARPLFAEDLPLFRSFFDEIGEEICVEVPRAIGSPLAWRWGVTWQGAPYPPERLAEIRAAAERARARCPGLMATFFAAVGDPERAERSARDACDQMMEGINAYAEAPREASEPIALWDWAPVIEHLAASLESVPPR